MSVRVLRSAMGFVAFRWRLLSALNAVFFGVALGACLAAVLVFPQPVYSGQRVYVLPQFLYSSLLLMFLFIFCFNLAVGAFAVVTLPGFLFFPLSSAVLVLRAVLWGLILYLLPVRLFLAALPTLVLEGEAYVLAAGVGTTVGFSWLRQPEGVSRRVAFVRAFKRDASVYVFVVLFLLAAALVESATIMLVQM